MIWYVIAFSWFDEWVKSLKCIIFSAHDLHSVLNTMGQQSLLNHISILAQAVLCLHSSLTTWFINNRVWLIFMLVLNHTCNNTVFCLHSLKKPRKQRTAACMFVISQDMKKKIQFWISFFFKFRRYFGAHQIVKLLSKKANFEIYCSLAYLKQT